MIKTGCDERQQLYGEVVKKLIPIIEKMYLEKQVEIVSEIQETMAKNKETGLWSV